MKLGTKSLLFGVHQFILHPLLVWFSWILLYKNAPNWKELICIFIHDWGYWNIFFLKDAEGDRHPEVAAKIANKLFGQKYYFFILGHSTFYNTRYDVKISKLMAPDKYWHCIVPFWFFKMLSIPSGEFKYYRTRKGARQVADLDVSDKIWWLNLQEISLQKVKGTYIINKDRLEK